MVTKPNLERRRIAAILREARKGLGFTTARAAAKQFNWNPVSYTSHENGTRGLDVEVAKVYAKAFNLKVSDLLAVGESIDAPYDIVEEPIVAGMSMWRDNELDPLPIQRAGETTRRRSLKMGDDSINRIVDAGELALYTPAKRKDVEAGNLVVIDRFRGRLQQRSIWMAESISTDGTLVLASFSTNPRYKEKLLLPNPSSDERVEVIGICDGKQSNFSKVTL